MQEKIQRARQLLQTAHHAAMATVNHDGSPHNTPYFCAHADNLTQLYWASNPSALHIQNVARTGQIFVVLYDARQGGGLYICANNAHPTDGAELQTAYAAFRACADRAGKTIAPIDHYQSDGPERIYAATVRQLWVNGNERGADGFIVRDSRYEITREDLLS
jgi:hypothetical protein